MKSQSENVFKEVVQILNDNKINYWICHGSLLGIIRDKKLLPWDCDIDFAVWQDEYTKEDILKLFDDNSKFTQIVVPEEIGNLHFLSADKRIDINFYERDKEKAYIRWIAPGNLLFRTYYFIVNFLNSNYHKSYIEESNNKISRLVKMILVIILFFLKFLTPKWVKKILYQNLQSKINYTGYSYSLDLMEFKKVKFLNTDIFIPVNSERMLEETYGKDWKTPKQDYVWHKEAKNLLKQSY